jgi:hypothetical protein
VRVHAAAAGLASAFAFTLLINFTEAIDWSESGFASTSAWLRIADKGEPPGWLLCTKLAVNSEISIWFEPASP